MAIGSRWRIVAPALIGVAVLAVAACSGSGVSQEDLDAAKAQLAAKEQELQVASGQLKSQEQQVTSLEQDMTALQQQLAGLAPSQVVQGGQLQPAVAGAQPTGWDTAESIRGGLKLIATFDSSGPDAWDNKAHPTVYFSSLGGADQFAGFYIVDAYTKEVVTSAHYDLGTKTSPHTTGVSPDGKWVYLQSSRAVGDKTEDITLIINARTLKIDKILKQESRFQGSMRVQRLHHVTGFVDSKGNDRLVLEYGFGSNGGPHFLLDPKDNNRVVMAITVEDTGYWMGHPFLTVDPTGKYLYVSLKVVAWGEEAEEIGGIAKINLETRAVTVIAGVGNHPIGISHTADGKFTYVVDGHASMVFKLDNATNEVVGKTSAGVAGPYGACMNWDETELYTVGKGEGSHNTGSVLGVIDLTSFRPKRGIINPIYLGGSARSIDHCFLHPDPAVNEIWVSNMAGFETIVLDLATRTVEAYIPTPNGENTHSGAFVQYNPDWTGKVLADHGGPSKELYVARLAVIAALPK
ncbi:MAG: hypothetical protein HY532_03170 [Chloroflexi bacterium]|nr:hypothetical protein [Chloroflexota bacterium]